MKIHHKLLSLLLALLLTVSVLSVGAVSAAAEGNDFYRSIYFDANSVNWTNYKYITFYLYDKTLGTELIGWGNKQGYMTEVGNGTWSYDLGAHGISFDPEHDYGCIFTADWTKWTSDLIIAGDSAGDTAYCTGEPFDGDMSVPTVQWKSGKYGNPIRINILGKVIGDCYWKHDSPYSLMVDYLQNMIDYTLRSLDKSEQEVIDYVAKQLGLNDQKVESAIADSGREFDWQAGGSPVEEDSPFAYKITCQNTVVINGLTPSSATLDFVVIPDEIKGYPVTEIGDWAFYNNKYLKNISLPDSLTAIGKGAFYGCPNLQWIFVPDNVTEIGANAFEKCLYLKGAVLSESLTAIADETFYDCRRLQSVYIPNGVTEIGEEAFYNCRSLKELVLPNSVGAIGSRDSSCVLGAFEDCSSLQTLVLPEGVTSIEDNAFAGCDSLTITAVQGSYAAGFAAENGVALKRMGGVTDANDLIGDMDGDLAVTIEDASFLQSFLAEFENCTLDLDNPDVLAFADLNHDGKVNITDVTMLQRFLAEMLEVF